MRFLLIFTSNIDAAFLYAITEESEAAKLIETIGTKTVYEAADDDPEDGAEERNAAHERLSKLLEDEVDGVERLCELDSAEETLDLTSFTKVRHIHFSGD